MVLVLPPTRLDPNAAPWGTAITGVVKANAADIERLKINLTALQQSQTSRGGVVQTASIDPSALDGMTLSDVVVQSSSAVNTGIKLNSSGLEAFDLNGDRTLFVDTVTGDTTFSKALWVSSLDGKAYYRFTTYDEDVSTIPATVTGTLVLQPDNTGESYPQFYGSQTLSYGYPIGNHDEAIYSIDFGIGLSPASGATFGTIRFDNMGTDGVGRLNISGGESLTLGASDVYVLNIGASSQPASPTVYPLVTVEPVSGKLGAALNTLPDEYLRSPLSSRNLVTGQNVNSLVDTGWYVGANMISGPAAEGTGWLWIMTQALDASNCLQIAYGRNTGYAWTRTKTSGVFSAWTLNVASSLPSVTLPGSAGFNSATKVTATNGIVTLSGLFTPSAAGSVTSTFALLGTLPVGYRPSSNGFIAVTSSLPNVFQCYVQTDGTIQIRSLGGSVAYTTSSSFSITGNSWVAA